MGDVRHRRDAGKAAGKPGKEENEDRRRILSLSPSPSPLLSLFLSFSLCVCLSLSIAVIEVGTKPVGKFQLSLPMLSATPLEKPIAFQRVAATALPVFPPCPSVRPPRRPSWRTSFQRRTIIDKSAAAMKITEESSGREREIYEADSLP